MLLATDFTSTGNQGSRCVVHIHGIGHFHPENVIDNEFFEGLDIGADDEWIVARTGIRKRHTALSLEYIRQTRNRDPRAAHEASAYGYGETGFLASRAALARAALCPSDIGMVIAGGCAPSMGAPAEACMIAERLGISVPCFDVNSACATWAVQMQMLSVICPDALPDFILLVTPDSLTRTVDYSDRRNAVLMGDCAVATIVSTRVPSRAHVRKVNVAYDPSGWTKVCIPSSGHLQQNGEAVQHFAMRRTTSTVERLRHSCRPNYRFVGHQSNIRMLRYVCERAGIEESRHLFNVDLRGNCGAAGAPSVISERYDEFSPGDCVLVALAGAGLTWAGLQIDFSGEGTR